MLSKQQLLENILSKVKPLPSTAIKDSYDDVRYCTQLLHICMPLRDKNLKITDLEGIELRVDYFAHTNDFKIGCTVWLCACKTTQRILDQWQERLDNHMNKYIKSKQNYRAGSPCYAASAWRRTSSLQDVLTFLEIMVLYFVPETERTESVNIIATGIHFHKTVRPIVKASINLMINLFPSKNLEFRYEADNVIDETEYNIKCRMIQCGQGDKYALDPKEWWERVEAFHDQGIYSWKPIEEEGDEANPL